jgi:Amt family ammonium transporter
LFGYSLSFGPDAGYGIIGNLEWIGSEGWGRNQFNVRRDGAHLAFMIFQAMFAIITRP